MNRLLLITAFLILFGVEILRVYFIMPFPGSQHRNTISLAYWLSNNIIWIRMLSAVVIAFALVPVFKKGKPRIRVLMILILAFYGVVFFFFNFRFQADKMFYQPRQKLFVAAGRDTTPGTALVIGVTINGESKAYPIQIIGYHHQVRDTVGHTPVMITYCTVCRTGRVFSPFVKGSAESFRLVGMDHFNAMFEDQTTGSWWQQATGVAVAGPLKGTALQEIPSRQVALNAWVRQFPQSLIMQPDTAFAKDYKDLAGYDKGTIKSGLEKRDSLSWKPKSWVIGVVNGSSSKAYDWNDLVNRKLIQDSLEGVPMLIAMEDDTTSFHVYDRRVKGTVLQFEPGSNNSFTDLHTHSVWNMDGMCTDGTLKGDTLRPIQSYNEFWHSWQTFHRNTQKYL